MQTESKLSIALVALFLLLASCTQAQNRNDPFNLMPDSNVQSTFRAKSQQFWNYEDASREGRHFNTFVYSGGLHATSGSVTTNAFATEAFVPERISEVPTAITYSTALSNDTCWTIISSQATAIAGWTRVGISSYYFNCQGNTSLLQPPALPAHSTWLMGPVIITSGAIVQVTDLRRPNPYQVSTINVRDTIYNAKGDGVADDYGALQTAFNHASALNARSRIYFPCGVYRTSTELTITQPAYITIEGESRHCVFIFHRGAGTSGAILIDGTSSLINVSSVRRNTSNASMTIRHIALGSTAGPALAIKNAGRIKVSDVALFSAGTGGANTYLLLDGGEDLYVEDSYLDLGNDSFPPEWTGILQGNITNPAHNVVVTSTASGGRYTLVDEIYFINCRTDGQTDGGPSFVANFGYGSLDFNPHFYFTGGKYTQSKTGDATVPIFDWTSVQITMIGTQMECVTGGCPGARIHNNGAFAGLYELIGTNGTNSSSTLYFVGDGGQHNLIKLIGGNYRTIKNDDMSLGAIMMTGVTLSSHPEGAVTNYLDPPNAMIFGNHVLTFPGGATVLEPLFTMFRSAGGINAGAVGASNGSQFISSRTAWSDTLDGVFEETVKARGFPSAASSTWTAQATDNIYSHFFRSWISSAKQNVATIYVDNTNLAAGKFQGRWTFGVADATGVEQKELKIDPNTITLKCFSLATLGTSSNGQIACCSDCHHASPCTSGGGGTVAIGDAAGVWTCP